MIFIIEGYLLSSIVTTRQTYTAALSKLVRWQPNTFSFNLERLPRAWINELSSKDLIFSLSICPLSFMVLLSLPSEGCLTLSRSIGYQYQDYPVRCFKYDNWKSTLRLVLVAVLLAVRLWEWSGFDQSHDGWE